MRSSSRILERNTTTRLFAIVLALAAFGCTEGGNLGACSKQSDLTGRWTLTLGLTDGDAGVIDSVIPRTNVIDADLVHIKSVSALAVGRNVWGTLSSRDKGFFDTLKIPELIKNNGSKTGAQLTCDVRINVPIAADVSDDNVDQGPNRISLSGKIVARGMMVGEPPNSTVIMVEDGAQAPRNFAWVATQP